MTEAPISTLRIAIRDLHGCNAVWVEAVAVHETFQGEVVWDGVVQVFEVDRPDASRAYAWSYETDAGKRRCVVVLAVPPVDSPAAAVRAAIAAQHKKGPGIDGLSN